jgi:hypothetical protein
MNLFHELRASLMRVPARVYPHQNPVNFGSTQAGAVPFHDVHFLPFREFRALVALLSNPGRNEE